MSRSPLLPLRQAAAIAALATAGTACATSRPATPSTGAIPAASCGASAPVTWHRAGQANRTVRVDLDVLDEASDGWRHLGRARLDSALAAWNAAGLPIRLVRESAASRADVHVVVLRRLPIDASDPANAFRAGVTHLKYDAQGEINSAQVMIAEETPRGARYSSVDQAATLLHELGHALGLPHSSDPRALMSPRTSAASLTPADLAMARSGYARATCRLDAVETAARPY